MKEERKVKIYIRPTAFAQRKLMIETYQKTHNISFSCRKAKISINTFRRWYPRYLEQGIEGIREQKNIYERIWEESQKNMPPEQLN